MGVAGSAPAYSMAVAMSTLMAAVGLLSVASIFYCGLIMFGIAIVYMKLNEEHPDAGGAYTWVAKVFHPAVGFFAGWSLLVATALFMVSGTIPAATATLVLVAPDYVNNPLVATAVAAGWLIIISAVVIKGIKLSSYVQIALTAIEVVILVVIIFYAILMNAAQPTQPLTWNLLSLTAFSFGSFAKGALTALFLFWGWDVTVNLSEETENAHRISGLGALAAMVVMLLLLMSFAAAVQLTMTEAEIEAAGTNIIFVLAEKLFPKPWGYLAIITVMVSTIGTIETNILQFTRTMYAKGRDSILHPRYATLHETWRTPWVATILLTVLGLFLLLLASFFPTVSLIIKDSVNAISFQVAFYYSLAGVAWLWLFRSKIFHSWFNFIFLGCWPFFSVLFLASIGCYSIFTFDLITTVIAIGGVAIGIVPYTWNRLRKNNGY